MISLQNNTTPPLGQDKRRTYPKLCTPAVLCDNVRRKKEKNKKKREKRKKKNGRGNTETRLAQRKH